MSSHKVEAGDLRDRPKHRSSCSTVEEDLAAATVMDGSALPAIDALPSYDAISNAPRAAGYRGSDFVQCAGFSDAEMLGCPHAQTVGVREAPRHEIAGGGAPTVQRALWGFSRGGDGWGGGLVGRDWAGPAAGRAIGDSGTSGKGVEPLLGGCHEPGMGPNKASGIVAG